MDVTSKANLKGSQIWFLSKSQRAASRCADFDNPGLQPLCLSLPAFEKQQQRCVHRRLQANHEQECYELPNFVID
jgi:hypothetical protein